MFRRYLTTQSERNIWGWFCKHLTTVDHVDHLCIKCVGNTGACKSHCSECLKTNCSICGKVIHRSQIFMSTAKNNYITESAIETLYFSNLFTFFKPKRPPAKWFRYPCYGVGCHPCFFKLMTQIRNDRVGKRQWSGTDTIEFHILP